MIDAATSSGNTHMAGWALDFAELWICRMCSLTRAFASGLTTSNFWVKSLFVRFVNAKDETGAVADDEAVAFLDADRSSDRCVLPSMLEGLSRR